MNVAEIFRVVFWLAAVVLAVVAAIFAVVLRKRIFTPKPFELVLSPALDAPEISKMLFHPFAQKADEPEGFEIVTTQVPGAVLKSHLLRNPDADSGDVVVFFHGNGEIAADWFFLAPQMAEAFNANVLLPDYRGYGLSTGTPTYVNMLSDAEAIVDAARAKCKRFVYVFGRSVGSAAAIHVAWQGKAKVLAIDSGFAHLPALIERLGKGGVQAPKLPYGFHDNADKLRETRVPTLFLHGVEDRLIPIDAARENYELSASPVKQLVELPCAGHNDTMLSHGYFEKINKFMT